MDSANFKRMVETVEIHDGLGIFEIKGGLDAQGRGRFESCLFFEGRPIVLSFSDCQGSIGQYLVESDDPEYQKAARQLISLQDLELGTDHSLGAQLQPLLKLFSSGTYKIVYHWLEDQEWCVGDLPRTEKPIESSYYPSITVLVRTVANMELDVLRVLWWRDEIASGKRPPIVTVEQARAGCSFIIDGHHRLEAYIMLSLSPPVVAIQSLNINPVSVSEVAELLEPFPLLLEDFAKRGAF
jgi:hypothetical protein